MCCNAPLSPANGDRGSHTFGRSSRSVVKGCGTIEMFSTCVFVYFMREAFDRELFKVPDKVSSGGFKPRSTCARICLHKLGSDMPDVEKVDKCLTYGFK